MMHTIYQLICHEITKDADRYLRIAIGQIVTWYAFRCNSEEELYKLHDEFHAEMEEWFQERR